MVVERCLVTGGAGCIGSELCTSLVARGYHVVALDNLSSGRLEHVEHLLDNPRFRLIRGDLLDSNTIASALDGITFVHHLAANPDVKFIDAAPDRDLTQNTVATHTLLEGMRQKGVSKLAFSSTSAVYGSSPVQPIPETQPCLPISLYGATKLACEAMISAYCHLFGFQAWIFRFANVVGGKVRKTGKTVISDFIAKLKSNPSRLEILGNGRQAKSYIMSSECVNAMLYIIDNATSNHNLFNLGRDDCLSVSRIAEMVVEAMGLKGVQYNYTGTEAGWPGDVPRFRLDVTALNQLGWRAKHTSEEAVASAIHDILAIS